MDLDQLKIQPGDNIIVAKLVNTKDGWVIDSCNIFDFVLSAIDFIWDTDLDTVLNNDIMAISPFAMYPAYHCFSYPVKSGVPHRIVVAYGNQLGRVLESIRNHTDTISQGTLSKEEMVDLVINMCWTYVNYWDELDDPTKTTRDRIAGCVFSMLAMMDGSNVTIPGFMLIPMSTDEDVDYTERASERPWPSTDEIKDLLEQYDIGGALHDRFHQLDPHTKK